MSIFEDSEERGDGEVVRTTPQTDPYAVAAGLLFNDAPFLIPLMAVLTLSAVCQGLITPTKLSEVAGLLTFDRFLQLLVMSFVVLRWRHRFRHGGGQKVRPLPIVTRIFTVGFLMWGAVTIPSLGATFAPAGALVGPMLFLFFIGTFFVFRLYFYYVVYGLLGGSLRDGLQGAIELSRREPTAAVRSMIAPLAATVLAIGLCSMPSPDGRSLLWATASSAAEGVFWLLSTYTGLAFALLLIDETQWRAAGLDPYRRERLKTLEAQGRASRFMWLSPRSGIKIFLVALLLVVNNLFQALQSAPSAHVTVEKCEASEHRITVAVSVTDAEHHFRGFNPMAFTVKTETGYEVSTHLLKVSLSPDGDALQGPLPPGAGPVSLYLQFRSNKSGSVLASLDNMWLWYNFKPLIPVRATLSTTPASTAP